MTVVKLLLGARIFEPKFFFLTFLYLQKLLKMKTLIKNDMIHIHILKSVAAPPFIV